jgi:hypothetical protein
MAWRTQRTASTGLENGPISRSRSHGDSDVEKEGRRYPRHLGVEGDSDDDASSKYSSRATSVSHQPMVNKAYTSKPNPSRLFRCSAGVMRYLCLGVAATILIFIFSLVRLSQASDKRLEIALEEAKNTPKPPLWETFPFLDRYYGGIRSLVDRSVNVPEYPREEDELVPTQENITTVERATIRQSLKFQPYKDDSRVECFLDTQKTVRIPGVRMYQGVPKGFPDAVMGSNTMLGVRNDICYDRFGRLGPYGLGYSLNRGGSGAQQEGEREGADEVWHDSPEVDYRQVKWLNVQKQCHNDNKHRFADLPEPRIDRFRAMQLGSTTDVKRAELPADPPASQVGTIEKLPRTAVIIRTWRDYHYTPEDLIYLRSLISELSLLSGGEYTLHFLIHVKDDNVPIWSDDETYDNFLRDALPEEFRGMGTLWSEKQMLLMYSGLEETWARDLPVHGVYRSTFMPMQYFAFQHPEFDYFWNWEMDIRYTGHWYHLFDSVRQWAKKQPRKFLWERNSRFYVPSEHGTWEQFSELVRFQTEKGTNSANNVWSGLKVPGVDKPQAGDRPIWGPERPLDDDVAFNTDPQAPTSFEKDKYNWGVGEEADLIVFNPLFDPEGTTWLLAEDTTGYNKTRGQPPRRTAIITASRLSRKLLVTMHKETALKRHTMFSEMWPATCALHHGLKAVYAPHSEYIDRKWPTNYLESVFNAGRNGATGASRTSVFGDREHNFRGTTWYYNAGFPEVLWHRWLGMRFNEDGGEIEEVNGEGRMCLPAMLLHPIKRVDLVQEGMRGG